MKVSFAYLPLYTGDYRRDTSHLTPLKHGIYLLLLMHCWDTKGPAPLDEQETAGICNCRSSDEIDALRYVLSKYFVRAEDGWYNDRMQREVERSENISRARSEAGKMGYEAKAKQLPKKDTANAKHLLELSGQLPLPPSPYHTSPVITSHFVEPVASPKSSMPACPVEKIRELWNSTVASAGGRKAVNMSKERRETIVRRWREVAPATVDEGLQWFETLFRDHVAASKFCTGKLADKDGRSYRIGIDVVFRSEQQLDEIAEGKYA